MFNSQWTSSTATRKHTKHAERFGVNSFRTGTDPSTTNFVSNPDLDTTCTGRIDHQQQ